MPIGRNILTLVFASICALPAVTLLAAWFVPDHGTLAHLLQTVLWRYLANAAVMTIGVGALSFFIGTITAWCITIYEFPFRRYLEWALLLPLAMPAYILAILYGHWFDPSGEIYTLGARVLGEDIAKHVLDVRSVVGAIFVLSLALYPYIYMLARTAFRGQCVSLFDAAWVLGTPRREWFWRVALPVARPALAAGVALVMMETLADFGVVSLFGVESFTTGIYRAWYGMGDQIAAAKLACVLIAITLVMLWVERCSRRGASYTLHEAAMRPITRARPGRKLAWLMTCICAAPFLFGFLLPLLQLLHWHFLPQADFYDAASWKEPLRHTLALGMLIVSITILMGLWFAYQLRYRVSALIKGIIRFSASGYAIPGAVIAVGIFIPLVALDKTIADMWESWGYARPSLLITGSIGAIVIGCVIRFLYLALGYTEAGFSQVHMRMEAVAATLGARQFRIIQQVHLPLLKRSLMMASFMIFTDVVKELPVTYMLRPFNFSTLSIRTYELAAEGQEIAAATPALMIVLLGLSAIALLAYMQTGVRSKALLQGI